MSITEARAQGEVALARYDEVSRDGYGGGEHAILASALRALLAALPETPTEEDRSEGLLSLAKGLDRRPDSDFDIATARPISPPTTDDLCPECHGEVTSHFCDRCGNTGRVRTPATDDREALTKQFADAIYASGLRAPDSTLAVIAFTEVLARFRSLSLPTEEQWEYRARATQGHTVGEVRTTPEHAISAYEEALDGVTFEQPDETPIVERRRVVPWEPVEAAARVGGEER